MERLYLYILIHIPVKEGTDSGKGGTSTVASEPETSVSHAKLDQV